MRETSTVKGRALLGSIVASFVLLAGQQQVSAQAPAAGSTAKNAATATPNVAIPDAAKLTLLVQLHITALGQANLTGNYTVLRELGSPKFQAENTPEKLAENFKSFRKQGIDISPAMLFPPILAGAPSIDSANVMRVVGFYDTKPQRISFNMAFQPINNAWRLVDIAVQTVVPSPAPASNAAPVAEKAPAVEEKPKPAKAASKK